MSEEEMLSIVQRIRENVKKQFKKALIVAECEICGSKENLEVHHLLPIAAYIKSLRDKGLSDEEIETIAKEELKTASAVILCKLHHTALHDIFGRVYDEAKIPLVQKWIQSRKQKIQERRLNDIKD